MNQSSNADELRAFRDRMLAAQLSANSAIGGLNVYGNGQSWVGDIVTIDTTGTGDCFGQIVSYPSYQNVGGTLSGSKPVVICSGQSHECKDLAEAQAKAEELAHKHGCDAFILKPIKKVSPKRDVTTTDLE